jgi:hypothetical protein
MAKERLADMAITDERGKGKGKKKCEIRKEMGLEGHSSGIWSSRSLGAKKLELN